MAAPGDVPLRPHTTSGAREHDGGQRRQQVREQQGAEDNRSAHEVAADQRVLDHAETEQRDETRDHAEDHRRSPKHRIGTRQVHADKGGRKSETGQGKETLLDVSRDGSQRIAIVEGMADLEEHEQGGEQEAERVADAHGEVFCLALEDVAGSQKCDGGRAVAEQEPVEDRPRADIDAHDARVPGEAPQHDEADRHDHVAQQRDAIDGREDGGCQRRNGEGDGEVSAVERHDEGERHGGSHAGGKGANSEMRSRCFCCDFLEAIGNHIEQGGKHDGE